MEVASYFFPLNTHVPYHHQPVIARGEELVLFFQVYQALDLSSVAGVGRGVAEVTKVRVVRQNGQSGATA